MSESRDAASLVVLYVGAFVSPLLAVRLRLSPAVIEILLGLLVGVSGLQLVHTTPFTSFLSHLGITFLMFLVGAEIDFNHIRREGLRSVIIATLAAAGILLSGIGLARLLGFPPYLGLVLGAMGCGILLIALMEAGQLKSRLGQLLLLVGAIGEFLTLFSLAGFNLMHRFGVGWRLALEAGRALVLFVVAYLLLALLRLLVWWAPHHFERLVHADDPSEIGVRAGFVLMLSLASLASLVGLESLLGAFLAGALFAFVFRQRGALDAKLSAIGQGFFIPLFFISVGVTFDVRALANPMTLVRTVALLAGASLLSKAVPLLLFRILGVPLRQIAAGAILLASPLTLLVAIAALGRNLGILDAAESSAVILLAITSGVIFPIGFKLLIGKSSQAS